MLTCRGKPCNLHQVRVEGGGEVVTMTGVLSGIALFIIVFIPVAFILASATKGKAGKVFKHGRQVSRMLQSREDETPR